VLRRAFLGGAFLGGTAAASLGLLAGRAGDVPVRAEDVLHDVLALGERVRLGAITQHEWRARIGDTLRGCSIAELWAHLDVDRFARHVPRSPRGAAIVRLPIAAHRSAAMRLFFFEAGRADPPHCHFNQVTAHLVLAGEFRVRHFDRLGEERAGVVIRPTGDRSIGPGDTTSISDERDNVHWHHALTRGVLLDVEQGRLDPSCPSRSRQLLDPEGPPRADGTILARRMSRLSALRRFG
jgi:hypothetical protein